VPWSESSRSAAMPAAQTTRPARRRTSADVATLGQVFSELLDESQAASIDSVERHRNQRIKLP
jgi:hypothetical protein